MAESLVPQQFNRPPGWRFAFGGLNLREVPDAVPVGKFPSVCNIRPTPTQGVQTRPGYAFLFACGNLSITDVGVYAALNTNNAPRYLARDTANNIYLDTGSLVVTLSGATSSGVWMLPFRPSQSPQSWMYMAAQGSYIKISAPSNNSVTVYKAGIAEPQNQVEAAPAAPNLAFFVPSANNQWNNSGTAGALTNGNRAVDTLGFCIVDPASADNRSSCQVNSDIQYQIGEAVILNADTQNLEIEDVLPPVDPSSIVAIQYASGNTGNCVIFPAQSPFGLGPNQTDLLGALRRGALIQYNNSEIAMVLSATQGPDGAVCFETSTNNSWVAGGNLSGVPAIILNSANAVDGANLLAIQVSSNVATGLGFISHAPVTFNPFTALLSTELKQEDQYIVFGFMVDNPNSLNEIRIQFNVDNESNATFTKNFYYYAIQPSQLAGVVTGATTQLEAALAELVQGTVPANTNLPQQTVPGSNQWTELYIPLTSLIRVGGDDTRTLSDCNGVQVLVNAANNMTFTLGDLYVLSGGEPDVGDNGANYSYRMVPRNSMTGVKGNPTPPMRYGIRPRRQRCFLTIPDASYDTQIDTWDVERYGGSVTEYRYIGSAAATDDSFEDNYFDDSALAGSLMETDNFEPWPSIDIPVLILAEGSVIITCVGTFITVSGYANWPTSTPNWLPGTLIQLGGQSSYTLRSRPVLVSPGTYQFETQECVGNIVPVYFQIQEPKVANSPNPYIWGPDVNGTFFGVGDKYRPGTISFSKSNGPDSVPDSYNLDLCPPSEPLQGGVIKGGVGLVASITRWWALYPQFSNPSKRYNPIEQPVGRGLAGPFGVTTDGAVVYFWAHDGICVTSGGPYESLTDLDLYPLFPHEGVAGVNITRNGITYYAPDYTRSSTFRLRKAQTYLFADYQDSAGNPHTLVCDLRTKGWMCDIYNDGITNHLYTTSQQSNPTVIMSDDRGNVYQELDCAGDNHVPIPCTIAVPEWDGGDLRSQPLFGDSYLDCLPNSTITAQPVSGGNNVGSPTTIPNTRNRTFAVVSVDGEGSLQKFLGCVYSWTE